MLSRGTFCSVPFFRRLLTIGNFVASATLFSYFFRIYSQFTQKSISAILAVANQIYRIARLKMETKLKMIYWKGKKFWVGKLLEHPEIMTQGETLEELEENMKEAYMLMTMDDVPEEHEIKEVTLIV